MPPVAAPKGNPGTKDNHERRRFEFDNPFLRKLLNDATSENLAHFPPSREERDRTVLSRIVAERASGRVLAVYPERACARASEVGMDSRTRFFMSRFHAGRIGTRMTDNDS
jgi:hypothetical protein